MRSTHVAGNKYSIVKHRLIINQFVVVTDNLTMYVWDTQQDKHCEDMNMNPTDTNLHATTKLHKLNTPLNLRSVRVKTTA
jgi:hypothetical protein